MYTPTETITKRINQALFGDDCAPARVAALVDEFVEDLLASGVTQETLSAPRREPRDEHLEARRATWKSKPNMYGTGLSSDEEWAKKSNAAKALELMQVEQAVQASWSQAIAGWQQSERDGTNWHY